MTTTKILKSFDQEFFDREGKLRCVLGDEQPLTMWFKELPLAGIHTFTRIRSMELELMVFACFVIPMIGNHTPVTLIVSFYADHIVIYAGGKIRKVAIDESITQLPPYIEFDCPFGTGPEIYFTNLYDGDQAASISPS